MRPGNIYRDTPTACEGIIVVGGDNDEIMIEVATECLLLLFYIEPRDYNPLDRTKSRP